MHDSPALPPASLDAGALDRTAVEALERVARLACRALDAPAAIVALDAEHPLVHGAHDTAPRAAAALCRHLAARDAPLAIADAAAPPPGAPPVPLTGALLGTPVHAADGRPLGAICVLEPQPRDWTDAEAALLADLARSAAHETTLRAALRRQASDTDATRDALRAAERRLATIVASAPMVLFALDAGGVVTVSEGKGLEALGRGPGEALGRSVFDVYADHPDVLAHCRRALAGERFNAICSVGERYFETCYEPVAGGDGCVGAVIGVATDITERHRSEQRVQHLAYHDQLTGLPNRLHFEQRAAAALVRARLEGQSVVLLHVDLDDFKRVNDALGHAAGDSVLSEVAERLRAVAPDGELIARHGGDEFMLLLEDAGVQPDAVATTLAARILRALEPSFEVATMEFQLGASIGISVYPRDGEYPAELMRRGDCAMYEAKAAGRRRYAFFDRDRADRRERLTLTARLGRALAQREFVLHYQPIFDAATGRAVAAEALIRWRDPELGLIPPGSFIPVAEDSGLIGEIGRWVAHEVCRQACDWRRAGIAPTIAFNVAPAQLGEPRFHSRLVELTESYGLEPEALMIEITESAVRDPERSGPILHALHRSGFKLAIDDFGADYSSLSRLRTLPFDVLKIDREFLRGVPEDPTAAAIVTGVITLAKGLGMTAVAEGVEGADQHRFLISEGCPHVQGFHLARPMPAHEARELLLERHRAAR